MEVNSVDEGVLRGSCELPQVLALCLGTVNCGTESASHVNRGFGPSYIDSIVRDTTPAVARFADIDA